MKRFLSTLLLATTVVIVLAQPGRVDSLRKVLRQHATADTFRVNRWNELAEEPALSVHQRDSVAQLALTLARQLKYPSGQARALLNRAKWIVFARPAEARQLLTQALTLAEATGDRALTTTALRFIGRSYWGDTRALPYYTRAFSVAKTSGQPRLIAESTDDIGTYYAFRSMYPAALHWYLRALRAAEDAQSVEAEVGTLHRISGVYQDLTDYDQALAYLQRALGKVNASTREYEILALGDMGRCYLLTGRYGQAIVALQRGIKASDNYRERPYFYKLPLEANLADTYERQHDARSFPYARRVMRDAINQHDNYVICRVSVTLGRHHLRAGHPDSAMYYGRQAIDYSRAFQNKVQLRDANQIMAEAHAQRRDFSQAYAYQSRYIAYKDSINNEDVTRKATAARLNDQMGRQRSQIALLTKDRQLQAEAARRQRQLLYGTLAVLALIGGMLVVLYRSNRHKQRINRLLERQKQELQTQRDQTQQALTELKTTQAQLIQREKMASLGELTAGIAHEIQNPLNFVNNFAEVSTELLAELKEDAEAGDTGEVLTIADDLTSNLRKISFHGQRASAIVKGMLEHSRSSGGQKEWVNLNALASEYLRLAYQGMRVKDQSVSVELVTAFDPALNRVHVIPQDVGRVLLNLYTNAFYTVQEKQKRADSTYQPTVTVSTAQTPGGVEIRVQDNGLGMTDAVKQKIFQPFFTTKPTGQGTGLGLSISYDVVTKGHGGELLVETEPGQGTELIVRLPQA